MADARDLAMQEAREAELIDTDWSRLAEGRDAGAPSGVDPAIAALSRRLHRELRSSDPSPAFVERLRREMAALSVPGDRRDRPAQRLGRPWALALPAAAALAVGAVVVVLALGSPTATVSAAEVLQAAAAAATSPVSAGIQSIILETVSEDDVLPLYQESVGGERQHTTNRYWYGGPGTERHESETAVLGANGQTTSTYGWTTVRMDGVVRQYRSTDQTLQMNVDDSRSWYLLRSVITGGGDTLGEATTDGLEAVAGERAGCYDAAVTGTEAIAGRAVYVLAVTQTGCFSNSVPGELQGRQVWFVDRESSLVLGLDRYRTDGALYSRMRATRLELNPVLDPAVFTLTVPEGTTVLDFRPLPAPTSEEFGAQLAGLARRVGFPVFAPSVVPDGLVPRAVRSPAVPAPLGEAAVLEYVVAAQAETDRPAQETGFRITQVRATYETLINWTRRAEEIEVGGRRAWLRDAANAATDSAVMLVRDGTLVQVSTFRLSADELITIAASLQPVSGGHEPLPDPTPPSIDEARAAVEFPIFVPAWVPESLVPTPPVGGRIEYLDAAGVAQLTVLSGLAGCCLSADARKTGEAVLLAGGIKAHLLDIQPEYGGPILWWEQEGAYVAVYGPQLSRDDLVRIAESVSSTASLDSGPH